MSHQRSSQQVTGSPLWIWGLLALLAFLPLPFGANRPWAADLMGVMTASLIFLMLRTEPNAPWQELSQRTRLRTSLIGFTLVLAWSFIQTLSSTPASWHHPFWKEAASILGPMTSSISIDPTLYFESCARFLSYILIFVLAFVAGSDSKRALLCLKSLTLIGTSYALYGLIAYATGTETILWYKKWAYHTFLTSTFVNKNSYAAYAGLTLLPTLSYVRQRFKDKWRNHKAHKKNAFMFLESLSLIDLAFLLSPIIILAALSLTGSRAGTISSLCAVMAFFISLKINRRRRKGKQYFVSALILLGFLFFVLIGGHTLITRFEVNYLSQDTELRLKAYKLALTAIGDNPWTGFGLDTFDTAFRLYRDATLPVWFHHAHNDYLEMIIDLGLPAALLLFLSLASLISCCMSGVANRHQNAVYPAMGVAASTLIIIHSLFDFSMHIPAIAALYAALLGIACAQSWSHRITNGNPLRN
jgi:O-antigen ligase